MSLTELNSLVSLHHDDVQFVTKRQPSDSKTHGRQSLKAFVFDQQWLLRDWNE